MRPLLGKTFDLNGDGHVSIEEELFGYTMMKKMEQEQQKDFEADELDEAEYHCNWNTYTSDYE